MRSLFFIITLLVIVGVAAAQEPSQVTIAPINYNMSVQDTITDAYFFDWWRLQANEGDVIVVEMTAMEGLSPLIGLLNSNGDLVARSDESRPPSPNSVAVLQYTAPETGQYTIIATREGNDKGTTTGSYTLIARQANQSVNRPNLLQPVEFRCESALVTTAATIQFTEDIIIPPNTPSGSLIEFYRITVYGLDGFRPVIQASASVQDTPLDCAGDAQQIIGDTYILPDGTTATLTETDLDYAAQLSLRNTGDANSPAFGEITLRIASEDGASGRYIAIIEGLAIQERNDADSIIIQLGPKARDTQMVVYMVGGRNSRLDPYLYWQDDREYSLAECDDAGQGICADVPSFDGAGAILTFSEAAEQTEVIWLGDRLDAGIRFAPGHPDPNYFLFASSQNRTSGPYAIVLIGELP